MRKQNINPGFRSRAVRQQGACLSWSSGLSHGSSLFHPGCMQFAGAKTILVLLARLTDTGHSAQDVKKSQMLDHLAEIQEKSPCCQALGTSGSKFDSHFAFPTMEECMKSHQALMMLLFPQLGEGRRAPANSEAHAHHWPSCFTLWLHSDIQTSFQVSLLLLLPFALKREKKNDIKRVT